MAILSIFRDEMNDIHMTKKNGHDFKLKKPQHRAAQPPISRISFSSPGQARGPRINPLALE